MAIQKWRHLGARLGRMNRDEFSDRCRQGIAQRCDAVLGWLGYDFAKNSKRSDTAESDNFFFTSQSVDSILLLLKQRLPGRAKEIVEAADRICRHHFDLLGYRALNYSQANDWGIDWHWDAVHRKRSPKKAFHRLRYLSYQQCGDSKVIWELNRHQHLVTLAKAYRLTHGARYADETLRQWRHWQAENPYPIGINWSSSLEVAMRSLSWLWTLHLLHGAPGVYDFRAEWLRSLALHGRHIERYLSTYFSPNTHLLGEGVGLFFLGTLCPELAAAKRWRSIGWQIILRESERQIREDGSHFEQSTYYHVYALDSFLHAAVLASLNNVPVPKPLEDRIEKMLSVLYLLGRSGPPPRFGDDDGGRLFDPRRNRAEHLMDPLATGAILFQRGDFKATAENLPEETLWLLGEEGVRQWDLFEAAPVTRESAALAESGCYLLTTDDSQLIVDAGPLGVLGGGHGHADALSVVLQSRGHSLLIDCGTYEYVGPGKDRNQYRGTEAHNTLTVDGLNQTESATTFSWHRPARSRVERWIKGQNFVLLIASHDGYQRLRPPVTHRRWVICLKNGAYLIRDAVEGSGNHRLNIAWHMAQDLQADRDYIFRIKDETRGLAFCPLQDADWGSELRTEMYSPAYGQKAPITVLNFARETTLPAEFAVVVRAWHDVPCGLDSLKWIARRPISGVSHYEYEWDGGRCSFVFNDCRQPWRSGRLSSDAEYLCHMTPHSSGEQLIFANGTYASIDGGTELRASRPVDWAELIMMGGERKVLSSDSAAMQQPATSEPTLVVSGES
jgi:Heparinase II/III-like protein/Heparinase II/III N-terminus